MGEISLVGVVDIMTGEKDPRNLMVVFSILKVVMVEWDIENHVEVRSFAIEVTCTYLGTKSSSFYLTRYTTTSRLHSGRHRMTPTV